MTMETKQNAEKTKKTIDKSNTKTIDDDKPALYTPSHIANYFLAKRNHDITNLKLNKIVYISFGWALAFIDKVIFNEPIQAWKFGPVIPSLYYEFKSFGQDIITTKSEIYNPIDDTSIIPTIDEEDDPDTINLLKNIYKIYGEFSAIDLIKITHNEKTPWHQTFYLEKSSPNSNLVIKRSVIKSYYNDLKKEHEKDI